MKKSRYSIGDLLPGDIIICDDKYQKFTNLVIARSKLIIQERYDSEYNTWYKEQCFDITYFRIKGDKFRCSTTWEKTCLKGSLSYGKYDPGTLTSIFRYYRHIWENEFPQDVTVIKYNGK